MCLCRAVVFVQIQLQTGVKQLLGCINYCNQVMQFVSSQIHQHYLDSYKHKLSYKLFPYRMSVFGKTGCNGIEEILIFVCVDYLVVLKSCLLFIDQFSVFIKVRVILLSIYIHDIVSLKWNSYQFATNTFHIRSKSIYFITNCRFFFQ